MSYENARLAWLQAVAHVSSAQQLAEVVYQNYVEAICKATGLFAGCCIRQSGDTYHVTEIHCNESGLSHVIAHKLLKDGATWHKNAFRIHLHDYSIINSPV